MRVMPIRRYAPVAFLAALFAVAPTLSAEPVPASTWAFEPKPDPFTEDALLDLRFLNEPKSGQSGFVRLSGDGNDFARGDRAPLRFWAVGTEVYKRSPEAIDRHCRFLAKRGVNMARLHLTVADTKEGAAVTAVNEQVIEGVFRFIKAAKENGIYVTISPYYGHHATPKSWGIEGYAADQKPWGAIFVDPKMQEGYRAWTRALYTRVNPHTGLAIKDDPTVAILQVHNEDSMFFWTMQRLPEAQANRLAKHFADWLVKRYGALDKAKEAWGGQAEKGDDLPNGVVALYSTWHLTQDWKGGTAKRVRDQTQFMAEFQRKFYADMGKYLRDDLGCRQLLNATNWRTANDERLKDIERWTYAALDVDAENEYYGSDYQHVGTNNGYRIDPDHFLVNESALHKPLEITTSYKQHAGHPFIVTETSWKHPNLYQSEGPFLVAAYQSLNGLDAVYWFTATDPEWMLDPRFRFWNVRGMNPINKWTCSTPMLAGMFPANAVTYRLGHLKAADTVVHEGRKADDLWDRKPALIDDNELYGDARALTSEVRTAKRDDGRPSRAAFLVGRVEASLGEAAGATRVKDVTDHLDPAKNTVRGMTGEVALDYAAGVCRVTAPKSQGVSGFLKAAGGAFDLGDVTVEGGNAYASVSVVALDDKPLAESRKVLIQVGTTARLTGWETKPATFEFQKKQIQGEQIVNTGTPPWRVADTDVRVTVRNPKLTKATRLDVNGYAAEGVQTTPASGDRKGVAVKLPANTMYLVLQ